MDFVPLHAISGYSFLKSGLKIDQYVKQVKKLGYKCCAISDINSLSSAPILVHEGIKLGIKTIIGEDFHVDNLDISLFVLNETGYENLLLINDAYHNDKLHIKFISSHNDGLAFVLNIQNDALKKAYITDIASFPNKLLQVSKGIKNFYLGIDVDDETLYIKEMREFAESHSYTTIAFPSIKYLKKEDAIILKMMESIETKEILQFKKLDGREYLLSSEEIERLYLPNEIEETVKLANMVDFDFIKIRGRMIKYENNLGLSSDEYLAKVAHDGLKAKNKTDEIYLKRLDYELSVIKKMGYSDYFLIVKDYIDFAKRNNIAVGPGRGSASGSLVSYALGITVPDPIEHNLLFERFLNEHRQTMPDIDVDFSDIHREEVVNYIRQKYGNNHVARIMTVQKIGAKQALNDVGRIFNYEKRDIELFTKLIKDEREDKLTLREIYKQNKDFRNLVNNDKYYLEIVSLASKIEGFPRQSSLHAVGIVLNADPLEKVIPLTSAFDGGFTEQLEKDYLEEQGFLKMDILALRNLTIVENCLQLLKQRGINIDRDDIPYDDEEAIKIIASGKTMGLFQLESSGMRNAIKVIKINNFEDVVALLALFRPGPMDNIKEYAKYKNNNIEIKYIVPALKDILAPTYGQIVYQEQIMQIASKMAGLSLTEADIFRRAISKKDSEKLASIEQSFIEGAIKQGYKKEVALEVYKLIYKFADYGFNRSHALVYAIFTSRMAYLKAHYPEEFYASILSNASTSEFHNTISEMKAQKIKAVCPNINESDVFFKIYGDSILFPLTSIKGVSSTTANNILEERKNGKFVDLFDFVTRMGKYKFNATQLNNLIDAGCFDEIEPSRASLRANVNNAYVYAEFVLGEDGMLILDPSLFAKPQFERVKDNELTNLNKEFEVLGLMISGSPIDAYKDQINKSKAVKLDELLETHAVTKSFAVIKSIKRIVTKKGDAMAFLTVYDDVSEMELTIFPKTYEKCFTVLKNNKVVVIVGYTKNNEFIVDNMIDAKEFKDE